LVFGSNPSGITDKRQTMNKTNIQLRKIVRDVAKEREKIEKGHCYKVSFEEFLEMISTKPKKLRILKPKGRKKRFLKR
jgi:hypothetical protein